MRSIRFFLVASILATLTLFNFIAALQGYQSSMSEAETLFDNQLQDIALLVAQIETSSELQPLKLKNDIIFQRWQDDVLTLASDDAPRQPIAEFIPGFSFANFSAYRWRTYVQRVVAEGTPDFSNNENRPGWVMVAERTDLRFLLAENVVLESVVPILVGIPLVGLLVWSIVSLGLRPMHVLSRELKSKQAQDLSPLHFSNTTRELEQVVDSINGFIRRLADVLEREKRFSADAAHELRTPISALKVQLHNLRNDIGAEGESYRQLQAGVERMQHLIEQLLVLSRTTPEKFAQNCQRVDIYELAQAAIARLYEQFEKKQQSIELDGESGMITGDVFALETLLDNLLSNANKYTPEHGTIIVTVKSSSQSICLSVEDNGPGIPPADRERIFERFYRADVDQQDLTAPGCGLGLTIVAQIARLHQADIRVTHSRFDSGTAFLVTFKKTS